MKKMIITAMAIVMALTITSCSTQKRSTTKTVSEGSADVHVIEQVYDKDDNLIEESRYVVTYETAEQAWAAVYGTAE